MTNIVLYASEIASVCDLHQYKPIHETFTTVLKRITSNNNFKTKNDKIDLLIKKIDKEDNNQISNLINDAACTNNINDVGMKIKSIKSVVPKSIIPEINTILNLIESVSTSDNKENAEVNLTSIKEITSKIDLPEANSILKTIDTSNNISLNEIKNITKQIKTTIPNDKILSKTDQQDIIKSIESKINCKFGSTQENTAINQYQNKYNTLITNKNNKFYKKKIQSIDSYSIYVGGYVDGIKDDGTIIEVKNRMRKFFDPLPMYDIIQLQTYLFILNSSNGELVEQLKDNKNNIKTTLIDIDLQMWENLIQPKIIQFCKAIIKILNNKELQNEYIHCSDYEQIELFDMIINTN